MKKLSHYQTIQILNGKTVFTLHNEPSAIRDNALAPKRYIAKSQLHAEKSLKKKEEKTPPPELPWRLSQLHSSFCSS